MHHKNKKYIVRLDADERQQLERLVSVGKGAARKLTRARVLLQADEGEGGRAWGRWRICGNVLWKRVWPRRWRASVRCSHPGCASWTAKRKQS